MGRTYITREKVLAFIKHFQNEGTIKTFTEGCCYWFAAILTQRFGGIIVYNPIENHFAALIVGFLFDITGEIEHTQDWVYWLSYHLIELRDADRVLRDCILKID